VPAWLLRILAFAVSLGSVAGSTDYVLSHAKNPAAPLQPAVVDPVESEEPDPTPVPTRTPRPATATPTPRPTLAATATVSARISTPTGTVAVIVTLPPTEAPTARPTPPPTARPTPTVQISAAVRATTLPRITTTHHS
jgi:hypothetical protein